MQPCCLFASIQKQMHTGTEMTSTWKYKIVPYKVQLPVLQVFIRKLHSADYRVPIFFFFLCVHKSFVYSTNFCDFTKYKVPQLLGIQ